MMPPPVRRQYLARHAAKQRHKNIIAHATHGNGKITAQAGLAERFADGRSGPGRSASVFDGLFGMVLFAFDCRRNHAPLGS